MRPAAPDWTRRASRLVQLTLGYNVVEAVVAVGSGIEAHSVALVGFGLDSVVELAASAFALWRIRAVAAGRGHDEVEAVEHRVHRLVGITFLLLAAYVVLQGAWVLWKQDAPEESAIGIVLATASLVTMPLIAWRKLAAADALGSRALRAEAKETLACAYLSLTLLLGLVANAAVGWWWADPVAALLMVPWLIKEGVEGVRGEGDED